MSDLGAFVMTTLLVLLVGGLSLSQIRELKAKLARERKNRAYVDHENRRLRRAVDEHDPSRTQEVLAIVHEEWREAHLCPDGVVADFTTVEIPQSIPDLWHAPAQSRDLSNSDTGDAGNDVAVSDVEPLGAVSPLVDNCEPVIKDVATQDTSAKPASDSKLIRSVMSVKYANNDGWHELDSPAVMRRGK